MNYSNGSMWDKYDNAINRVAELEAENDNLRSALKPFALLLADRHFIYKDDAILPVNIMVGWLRKADHILKGWEK